MTNKEIADIIRYGDPEDLAKLADTLDPPKPKPKPGLVRFNNGTLGFVVRGHLSVNTIYDIVTEYGELLEFDDALPYKPARILADVDRDRLLEVLKEALAEIEDLADESVMGAGQKAQHQLLMARMQSVIQNVEEWEREGGSDDE
jgi:hypothetical protein